MSTYAQISDYQNYTALPVKTNPAGLQALIDAAENDIDKILPRMSYLTNAIVGITLSGATGGAFALQLTWRGIIYTSGPIPWNAHGADLLVALQSLADPQGNFVPPGTWQIPEARYYQQKWAYGPLPGTPIVVQAVNSMGRQKLQPFTVVNNTLAGTNPRVTAQTIVGGGLRINPYLIPADYADLLKSAVCAQAEYRDQMGPRFFSQAQFTRVDGPEFRTRGKLPLIGPKVMRELSGTDLIQRGARARPGTSLGRAIAYGPIGGTPIPDDWRAV